MHSVLRLTVWLLLCGAVQMPLAAEGPEPGSGVSVSGASSIQPPPADRLPAITGAAKSATRIHASYEVLKGGITVATITETYTRTKNHYRIESVSRAVGLLALFKPETIRVTSEGVTTAKGLRPTAFTSKRELDTERNTSADFDWAASRITLTDRAGKRTLPLPDGTQDRLSAMYQFMFIPLQNTLDFYMTNGSKVDIYNYLITHGQRVTIPLGEFKALYVANQPKDGESRTEIWLAAEHAYLPYKVVITDPDGDKLTQVLTHVDIEQ